MITFPTSIAYDCEQRRPACPLIQIGMGGNRYAAYEFPTQTWLQYPTDAMRVYPLEDQKQLEHILGITMKAWEEREK